jgi:hypothetical protein
MKITQTREFTETLSQRGVFCKMFFDRDRAAASLSLQEHSDEAISLTPQQATGNALALDSRTMQIRCSFSASLSLQSPHAFAIMNAVGKRSLRAGGFPGEPADNFLFSLYGGKDHESTGPAGFKREGYRVH